MKKLLLTLALAAMSTLSYAQGTIAFGNSIAATVKLVSSPGATPVTLPTSVRANFGVFWGTSAGALQLNEGALGTSSTSSAGIIVAPSVYGLNPGSEPLQTVFMQIRGWDASFGNDWAAAQQSGALFGQTDVRQVTLGPTAGPGTVIWQGATGTIATRFNPLVLVVPEPSTIALGVLGLGSLLLFRRRQAK
jgi:hypothetical protein